MMKFILSVDRIDAVYERSDGNILFFSGDLFWTSDGNYFIGNYDNALLKIIIYLQMEALIIIPGTASQSYKY